MMTADIRKAFGRLLRELREEKKLDDTKVALMLGVQYRSYKFYEQGMQTPSLGILLDMHELLGLELSDILATASGKRRKKHD